MYIAELRIENYKSFHQATTVQFKPGFNVIIGANNAGKTALLEALGTRFQHVPHKSQRASPTRGHANQQPSIAEFAVSVNREDFNAWQRVLPHARWFFPHTTVRSGDAQPVVGQLNGLLESDRLIAGFRFQQPGGIVTPLVNRTPTHPSGSDKFWTVWSLEQQRFVEPPADLNLVTPYSNDLHFPDMFMGEFPTRVYVFRAERMNIARSPVGAVTALNNDGSNLPTVLNNLKSSNSRRFAKFLVLVQRVLPQVQDVTVPPIPGTSEVEIRIWNEPQDSEREDLAVPLSDCGTGVSQVLALLYVVVTSATPMTIVIDEPQSFLNPGASRKLFEILSDHPQHQYILSTHSPTLLSSLEISTLTLVRKNGTESELVALDPREVSELKLVFHELGAHLADVYGADRVLWVEGPTEERCFPMILEHAGRRLNGLAILGVLHTGDFDAKPSRKDTEKADLVFQIYAKLKLRGTLLPPAVGFVFDREQRSALEMEDLTRRGTGSGAPVHFIARTMYENYLLAPDAIAFVINDHDSRAAPLTSSEVRAWLEHRWQGQASQGANGQSWEQWLETVHAGSVLEDLFNGLTEARVAFRKTTHSPELTRWLLEHEPDVFAEVRALLLEVCRDV